MIFISHDKFNIILKMSLWAENFTKEFLFFLFLNVGWNSNLKHVKDSL